MEHRPFGVDRSGEDIHDVSGVTVKANVDYLEESVARAQGPQAGDLAVEELARILNARLRDPAYHVSPRFLKNPWNSYSYEFVCFLGEFCKILSHDPLFPFNAGKEKFISPIIQTLARPLSLPQIYKMFPHFGEKFAKGSCHFEVISVKESTAVLRMQFTERVARQFGPYRLACAELICQSAKAGLSAVPERVHNQRAASIKDLSCMADGADYCEWEFAWEPTAPHRLIWHVAAALLAGVVFVLLRTGYPEIGLGPSLVFSLLPSITLWLASDWWRLRSEVRGRQLLIDEQRRAAESRHEELRETSLGQEQSTVQLRRTISQLTTLHNAGLIFSSTFDRETLIQRVLKTVSVDLHYERAMIGFLDRGRQVLHDIRIFGVPEDITLLAHSMEIPLTDPQSLEWRVLLQREPILVDDLRADRALLHPLNQQLASAAGTESFIAAPLITKDTVIGCLVVDHTKARSLTHEDLGLIMTLANHVAIALDNAAAYQQIEELNVGLEAKVHERTVALQASNDKLKEHDHLKSVFVSTVSHELRTPLTSMKGYVENMLDGLAGRLTEKQSFYLSRVKHNTERLTRMIHELLDISRIEAGQTTMQMSAFEMRELLSEVADSLLSLAEQKRITVEREIIDGLPTLQGDRDKLQQVLTNLLQNAIKFTPERGAILIQSWLRTDGQIQVSVVDNGCGIPPHELDRVFEKFYRG
ncbi:MAG: sensor histidine kinase, partial [Nitrospiraceae bacterium]